MSRPLHTACFFAAWKRVEANPVPSSRSGHRALLAAGRYADSSVLPFLLSKLALHCMLCITGALLAAGCYADSSLLPFLLSKLALHCMLCITGAFLAAGRYADSSLFAVSVKQISPVLHTLHNRGAFGWRKKAGSSEPRT